MAVEERELTDGERRAIAFWAELWRWDFLQHGYRRPVGALARDVKMKPRTLERQIQERRLPKSEDAARLARAAGVPADRLYELLLGSSDSPNPGKGNPSNGPGPEHLPEAA